MIPYNTLNAIIICRENFGSHRSFHRAIFVSIEIETSLLLRLLLSLSAVVVVPPRILLFYKFSFVYEHASNVRKLGELLLVIYCVALPISMSCLQKKSNSRCVAYDLKKKKETKFRHPLKFGRFLSLFLSLIAIDIHLFTSKFPWISLMLSKLLNLITPSKYLHQKHHHK